MYCSLLFLEFLNSEGGLLSAVADNREVVLSEVLDGLSWEVTFGDPERVNATLE